MSAQQQLALMEPDGQPAPELARIQLTDAQRAAIERRDGDVFTEAGAGSGKTRVLVERYCDCVTEDGLKPDEILAFTFTDRAAGELRQRVRSRLIERARAAVGNGDRELALHIISSAREGERAWITTIHGFCRRVLAAHPLAARLDPRFRVLDEAESARLRTQAFDAALQQVVGDGGAPAARFAAAFNGPRLRDMIVGIHERLRSQGADPPRLPDPGRPVRSDRDGEDAPELTQSEVRRAEEGLATVNALLASYDREYRLLEFERSGVDFTDLELRALELVRGSGPIAQAWRERFAHVMVDEFQDTNRVQLALIDALCGPQARLFVVGDEFQSIYRFRHADLQVFRERRAAAAEDPRIAELPLRGNFRSNPAVLAAVDFMGRAMFGDAFAPLEAGREAAGDTAGEPPVAELLLTDTAGDRSGKGWRADDIELELPPGETNPAYVAEARFLAQRLAELRSEGVERGDMVVLLRAFTHVDTFEEALARADLAPYVVGGRGYWSQQQVEDTIRLLGVVANPLDDEILFGALASPACGLSADALWLLRQGALDDEGRPRHVWPAIADVSWPDGIPDEDAERLERFRKVLIGLRAEAPLYALDAMVDRVITAFGYDLAILQLRDGSRRMANIRKLMRLAAEYEEHDGRDLRGFLDFAEERTRRDEREGMAAVQVEGHDGVRVMTVHAAKGLEFPVVAVADMGRGLGMGFSNPDLIVGRLREVGDPTGAPFGMRLPVAAGDSLRLWRLVELCDAESEAEVEEALRLTYVAATRAQERLILSGSCNLPADDSPESLRRSHSVLQVLLPALREHGWTGEDGELEIPHAPRVGGGDAGGPPPRMRVQVQRAGGERAKRLRMRFEGATEPLPVAGGPSAPLLAGTPSPQGAGHLSYSALAGYAGCGYRFYVERILGLGSPAEAGGADGVPEPEAGREVDELLDPSLGPRERSLAIGSAVHALLEAAARRSWGDPAEDEVERLLARERIVGDTAARERVTTLVNGWLASGLAATLRGDGVRVRPEVPFLLDLGGTIVRGKIDLLAEMADGPLVVDYKTDAVAGADPTELAARYEIQRDVYALAVARAGRVGSEPIRAAYCFLEDPERTVVESYDDSRLGVARERIEALIARIRAGEFARTDSPHLALCHGCPAAARLCGAPAWKPQWARAA
ncbi:MAG: UvrD-helicase domain-containing protein [Solirubrobacterales bacterium]